MKLKGERKEREEKERKGEMLEDEKRTGKREGKGRRRNPMADVVKGEDKKTGALAFGSPPRARTYLAVIPFPFEK